VRVHVRVRACLSPCAYARCTRARLPYLWHQAVFCHPQRSEAVGWLSAQGYPLAACLCLAAAIAHLAHLTAVVPAAAVVPAGALGGSPQLLPSVFRVLLPSWSPPPPSSPPPLWWSLSRSLVGVLLPAVCFACGALGCLSKGAALAGASLPAAAEAMLLTAPATGPAKGSATGVSGRCKGWVQPSAEGVRGGEAEVVWRRVDERRAAVGQAVAVALGPAALEFLAAREAAEPPTAPAAQPPTGKGRGGSRAAAPGRTGRWSWLGLGPRRWPLRAVLCCAGGAGASVLGCALRQGLALAVAGAVAQRNMEATAKQVDGGIWGGLFGAQWVVVKGAMALARSLFISHNARVGRGEKTATYIC